MERVAIIGMGLMGSSLGLALKKNAPRVRVHGYARRAQTRRQALEMGAADRMFEYASDAALGADLVVICVPIWSIARLAEDILPALKAGAVVTDVGSTKTELVERMEGKFAASRAFFVGSHPIAGSEKVGVLAGTPKLYRGRLAVVCPVASTPPSACKLVRDLWALVGAEVVEMSAQQHDATLAATSHLPHMVAAALARSIALDHASFCGTGFKDTTRVASGSAEMWVDIIDTNRVALAAELDRFHDQLEGLIAILKAGNSDDIHRWLKGAAENRNQILKENRFLK